ncbi:MAG: sugar ABC transporter permease [Pirellulaceae bacterium]
MPDKQAFRETHDTWSGLAFAAPWIVGFLAFFVWPFAASVYWSFCDFDMVNPPEWVGTKNYQRLFQDFRSQDAFGLAVANTIYYVAFSVPLSIVAGVVTASLLSRQRRGVGILRTVVYLPSVLPVVAVSILWVWLLDPSSGWVNEVLNLFGLPSQNWLNQSRSLFSLETISYVQNTPMAEWSLAGSKDGLILLTLWGIGNYMVIYLAAMSDIPHALYEAIELDGAGRFRKFWNVTLPMLSPVLFFHLVIGFIKGVQTFASVYILSEGTGAPGGSLTTISLQMFLSAFNDLDVGYASAMAWILLLFMAVITFLLFRTSKQWVHYRMSA